jgi:hypothetical protein
VSREHATQLLTRLVNGFDPLALEIIGLPDSVSIQSVCAAADRTQTGEQIKAYFPEAIFTAIARSLFKTVESIATPCSVKT